MRIVKTAAVIAVLVLIARYFPVFYYTSMFNDFVKQEAQRTRVIPQLENALLRQADAYFLPVKADDIKIQRDGDLLRVKVDYRVPVNLFIFKHELSFHATGAGLALSEE